MTIDNKDEKKDAVEGTPKKTSKFASALKSRTASTKGDPSTSVPQPMAQASTHKPPQSPLNSATGFAVSGRIVGSAAKEPDWTPEQLQAIATRRAYRLPMAVVTDSRRTEVDPQQKYVRKDPNGTVTATANSMLPNLPLDEFILATGEAKPDTKLKPAMYSDVIILGKDRDWTLSQWVIKDVILEPVPAEVRRRGMAGPTRQAMRTSGAQFARLGFPIMSLGPPA
jgi:hypothetical protein